MAKKPNGSQGVYYGWVIVAISFVALLITTGSTSNAFGLYIVPVSQAFGLSRASMNSALILMNAGSAIAALTLGRVIDRYPARVIMGISGLALGGSLVVLGLSRSLWLDAAILILPLGFAMSGLGNLMSPTLVARWFTAHRGRALAITMLGMSSATVVATPLIALLVDGVGWRASLIAVGAIVIGAVILLLPMVRNAPEPGDRETSDHTGPFPIADVAAEAVDPGLTQRQLLANPGFLTIAISTALAQAIFQALLVSTIPIAREIGFSNTKAASLISALGMAGIVGKLLVAVFADRVERVYALTAAFLLMPVASAMMLFAHGYPMLLASSATIGFSLGVTMPMYLALLADRFGARSLGRANGMIMFGNAVIGAVAVRYAGEVYDRTGSYNIMFFSFIGLGVLAAALMFSSREARTRAALMPAE